MRPVGSEQLHITSDESRGVLQKHEVTTTFISVDSKLMDPLVIGFGSQNC